LAPPAALRVSKRSATKALARDADLEDVRALPRRLILTGTA
jgi:hypothetical protein